MRDVDERIGIGPAHVEGRRGALDRLQSEIEQEPLGNIHIRNLQSGECDVGGFDDWHGF